MTSRKRVCVIGAGGSGICSIKSCLEGGLDVVCYERSDSMGGLWRYREHDEFGQASVMRSTVINTSKEMSAFSDFPPPDHFANFMHNRFMYDYLTSYAKNFAVSEHIKYKHDVRKVSPADDYDVSGKWKVSVKALLKNEESEEIFDGVLVCSGHHVFPIIPELPGLETFRGKKIHTHSLKSAEGMEGKEVLVVGNGNSGVDAAAEISNVSKQVYLSTRRGFWLIGRAGTGGRPLDGIVNKRVLGFLPCSVGNFLLEWFASIRLDHEAYNLKPTHRADAQHPTLNDALPSKILSGTVRIKGAITRFTERGVIFSGEDREQPLDAVILATGYSYKFPFLDEEVARVNDSTCELYKLVFPPNLRHPSLAFIGIAQPMGCILPISEIQARWFVQLMTGKCRLPSSKIIQEEVKARQEYISRTFIKAVRHTTEVIWIDYMDAVAREFGVKPNMWKLLISDPALFLICFFGPCLPYQFRLVGPHPWKGARKAIFGCEKRVQGALNTRSGFKVIKKSSMIMRLLCFFLIPVSMYIMLFVIKIGYERL